MGYGHGQGRKPKAGTFPVCESAGDPTWFNRFNKCEMHNFGEIPKYPTFDHDYLKIRTNPDMEEPNYKQKLMLLM